MSDKHCNTCANLTSARTCAILQGAVLVRQGTTGNALGGISVGVRNPEVFCCNRWTDPEAMPKLREAGDDASD